MKVRGGVLCLAGHVEGNIEIFIKFVFKVYRMSDKTGQI